MKSRLLSLALFLVGPAFPGLSRSAEYPAPVLAAVTVSAPTDKTPAGESRIPATERLDQLVAANLAKQGLQPNPPASDEILVRRLYLDIIGRIPTKAETLAFLDSKDPRKRDKLIDTLLESDGYVSHFYNFWADILRAKSDLSGAAQSLPAGNAYADWIKQSLRENKPYDTFVREMITASGSTWENPAIGYYIRDYGMPLDNLAVTTQVFLGTQIVCAQCHNHPFDKWTQMDYYHLAAFTYGQMTTNNSANQRAALALAGGPRMVKTKSKNKSAPTPVAETEGGTASNPMDGLTKQELAKAFSEILKPVRFNNVVETERTLTLPHDYKYDDAKPKSPVTPKALFGPEAPLTPSENPIQAFALWMTSQENPRFTKVIANRLWKRALGLGLIEPVDELRDDTVASNPELMDFLEGRMKAFGYDMKKYLRMIYTSATYQREASPKEVTLGETYHFPGPILRRMSSEQIWDSLVSMAVENPDAPDPAQELAARRRLTEVELIGAAVYDMPPADFLAKARDIAQVQKTLAAEIQLSQSKLAEARATRNPDAIKTAVKEAAVIRRRLETEIEKRVYRAGLEEKLTVSQGNVGNAEEADAFLTEIAAVMKDLPAESHDDGPPVLARKADREGKAPRRTGFVNDIVSALLKPDLVSLRQAEKQRSASETAAWGIDTPAERRSYANFSTARARMIRASELPSPAPRGHFLREFGQSDRELVENSTDQASITQALSLLNGPYASAVASRFSVIGREIAASKGQDARLDTIYLTMMSRRPTAEERRIFAEASESMGGSLPQSGIIWTLLNTRQFFFIQ
ncbi:MAG: DUF1549 domain-containing protein [Verrucomicrobiales bacterium]